jgi:hypothetical protein
MTVKSSSPVSNWVAAVSQVVAPHLHQIPYGNLRTDCSEWESEEGTVTNLAIVYEVPGGSTNQLNISYCEQTGAFTFIAPDTHTESCTPSLDEVTDMIARTVAQIPAIRRQRLQEDIDHWASSGMSQRDLFQRMTKMLSMEGLRGGAITLHEMKDGIGYIVTHYRTE